jgi:hypothetical protein
MQKLALKKIASNYIIIQAIFHTVHDALRNRGNSAQGKPAGCCEYGISVSICFIKGGDYGTDSI